VNYIDTWKDGTSHSQGDIQRVQSVWTKEIGGIRISVLWGHLYMPSNWILHADPWFNTYDLGRCGDLTPEQAVRKALRLVATKVNNMHQALQAEFD
jgi:hypothetical protein